MFKKKIVINENQVENMENVNISIKIIKNQNIREMTVYS